MEDNKKKSAAGNKQDELLKVIAQDALDHGYVSAYHYKYQVGEPGFSNTKQFFCPCELVFDDGEKWLLYTSTSYRSDRAKEWHWDASNIKRIDGANKAYLVYSESTSLKEQQAFIKAKDSYSQKDGLYAIDDVFSESQIENEIQNKGLCNANYGLSRHLVGTSFESKVVDVLNNKDNLAMFQSIDCEKTSILRGRSYKLFCDILNKAIINKNKTISSIIATCEEKKIGRLPSNGKPKTDVWAIIVFNDGSTQDITISCKRSNFSIVSVHQYKADSFSKVLDESNDNLKKLLNLFQENPSLESFGATNGKLLTEELKPYLKKLVLWVLGGKYGEGNNIQIAQYILVYNDEDYVIHHINNYAKFLLKEDKIRHFGTPFSWTYASGQRGKSIQLKCPLLK